MLQQLHNGPVDCGGAVPFSCGFGCRAGGCMVERGQLLGVYCRCRRTRRAVPAERARQPAASSCACTHLMAALAARTLGMAHLALPCVALPRWCLAVIACQCAAHNWGCVFSTFSPLCKLPAFFIYRPCRAVPPWCRRTSHACAPAWSQTGPTSPNKLTPLPLTERTDPNCPGWGAFARGPPSSLP